jgi:hypothetical protein
MKSGLPSAKIKIRLASTLVLFAISCTHASKCLAI